MATRVNRYTKTQDNVYQPRTLQELMVAPAYKRQKHDDLNKAIMDYETALAQADGLDAHGEVLSQEQQKLYDAALAQRDKLESEGFSQSSKSDFIRFNKEFQTSVGPKGKIGRIGAAKKAYETNKKTYIANAVKDGYSPEQAEINWNKHSASYNEDFTNTGEIKNIDELYAPKYVNHLEEAKEYFDKAGITASEIARGNGRIVQDEKGSYVVNTKSLKGSSTNIEQLQAAVNFLNNRVRNPKSDLARSLEHQGISGDAAIADIMAMDDIYKKSSFKDHQSNSINSYKPPTQAEQNFGNGNGLVSVSTNFNNKIPTTDYNGMKESIKNLESKDSLSKLEQVELEERKFYAEEMEKTLRSDDTTSALMDAADEITADMEAARDPKNTNTLMKKYGVTTITGQEGLLSGADILQQKLRGELQAVNQELEPAMEAASLGVKFKTNNYGFGNMSTKQKSLYNNFNESLNAILSAGGDVLENNAKINNIERSDGQKISLEDDTKKAISNLVAEAGFNKGVKLITMTPKERGSNLPGYRLAIDLSHLDESVDLPGTTGKLFNSSNDNVGGDDHKYIYVDIAFKENVDNIGIRNLSGFAVDYLRTGGADGQALAQEMQFQQTRDKYYGASWSSSNVTPTLAPTLKNGNVNPNYNPILGDMFLQEIKKEALKNGENVTPENYKVYEQKVLNKTIK